jgi:hypothetical protein
MAGDETVRLEVVGGDDVDGNRSRDSEVESTVGIASSKLSALESKLESAEGVSGLATWLREVEEMVSAIKAQEIGDTRNEIREVIDKLLQINAEVQNLLRLKKLLS